MANLWDKDRKKIFRELYQQYVEEGFNHKEAKRLASRETDELIEMDQEFIKEIFDSEILDDE